MKRLNSVSKGEDYPAADVSNLQFPLQKFDSGLLRQKELER